MCNWNNYTAKIQGFTATDYDLLNKTAKGVVLDVGCGLGGHLARLNTASLRVGIDPGLSGLKRGKKRFPENIFICANAYRLPFLNDTFDTVICIDVIEHVDQPLELLKEIKRVLKQNGLLFLQTPNYPVKRIYDFWHWVRKSRKNFRDDPTHITKLNTLSLKNHVQKSDLEVQLLKARNLPFQLSVPFKRSFLYKKLALSFAQKIILIARK